MNVRNIVLAGTVAIAAALSSGAASAAPASAIEINVPTATENAVTQAYYPGGYIYKPHLCYVPFFKLARWFGPYRARLIKRRCFYKPYYAY